MSTAQKIRRQSARGCIVAACIALPLAANATAISASSVLNFDTTGQSLWGTGTTDVFSSTSTTHFTDIVVPRTHTGDVVDTSVPNPAYAAWATKYATKLIGCLGDTGCASDAAGPAPSKTLTSRDGVLVYYDGHFESGINNRMTFDPGSVDAAYNTTASLTANKDAVAPGEMFSLTLSQSGESTSLDTQFSNIDYTWNAFVDMATDIDMSTWVAGDRTDYNNLLPINTGYKELELFGAQFTDDTISARLLGAPLLSFDEGVNIPVDLPLVPLGNGLTASLPIYEAGYYTPNLDTSATQSGSSVSNSVGPGSRLCLQFVGCPVGGTDLVKMELDLDVLSTWAAGIPLGGALTTFPLGPRIEQNALDADVALYSGYQQQMNFQANLGAMLEFSTPAQVEVAPGVFSMMDQVRVGVGDTVNIIRPAGDFSVTPVYDVADNQFSNTLDEYLQFLLDVDFLNINLSTGALFGSKGFDISAVALNVPLGNQILNTIFDNTFSLGGFSSLIGTPLAFTSAGSVIGGGPALVTVAEPNSGVLVLGGMLALLLLRRRGKGAQAIRQPGRMGSRRTDCEPVAAGVV